MVFVLYLNQNTIINNNLKSSTQEMNMQKNGEEYELFVQDIYKILNCADGLKDVVVQHDVKIEGVSREHQIDVYWQFTCGTVTYRVAVECKDYKNPVTAEKIEAFRATLLDIGDIHGIFAARNGFQSGAQKVAKTYGIQLVQIREPLESDWRGYIKDIHINYTFRFVVNVRPHIYVNKEWTEENEIKQKIASFKEKSDQTYIVKNKGLTNEDRITVKQLIDKLPSDEEGRDRRYLFEFDNAYLEYEDEYIKIDKIEFTYDVEFSYDTQHISMMNMARAIVNNVITGESFLIDITGNVKNWGKLRNRYYSARIMSFVRRIDYGRKLYFVKVYI